LKYETNLKYNKNRQLAYQLYVYGIGNFYHGIFSMLFVNLLPFKLGRLYD